MIYDVLDERFRACARGDRQLETLHQGSRWAEGPVWVPAGRYLLWSDIPNDRLLRWDETTGVTGVFRSPAGFPNGNTLDAHGRLVTCEQGNRRVTRTEHDGSVTVVADRFEGHRLNSPNDAAVRSDGTLFFSDPDYGILDDYEGNRGESEIGGCHVYRVDAATGAVTVAAEGFTSPNGLVFSPDESRLYVSDSGANRVRSFAVDAAGVLSDDRLFAKCSAGNFDNIRFDTAGRLWVAAIGDGVHCYDGDGTLLGKIRVPEPVANITFGGSRRNCLFIAATTSIYALLTSVTGAVRPSAVTAVTGPPATGGSR